MNMSLSPVMSRSLALALAIALAGAIYSLAFVPVLDAWRGHAESIERSRDLIARYGRIAAHRETYDKQLAMLRERSRSSGGYIEDKSATLAAARLQNRIKRIVTGNGGTIRSLQSLPPQKERDLERISVRVQMTARIGQLQKIFHAFESGATFLFLDDVNVRVQRARRARRGRRKRNQPPPPDERLLTVRLNIYGFARREES